MTRAAPAARRRMAHVLALLASTVLTAPALGQGYFDIRLYFSHYGWTAPQPAPQPVPGEAQHQANATLTGGGRLYLWAQALNGSAHVVWDLIGLNIDVDGPAQLVGREFFTPAWPHPGGDTIPRWDEVHAGTCDAASAAQNGILFTALGGLNGAYGVRRAPRPDGFVTGDAPGDHVLLGYVDVDYTGPGAASVWLEISNAGIAARSPLFDTQVYFGFGDGGLEGNDFQQRSQIADALIVPEPRAWVILSAFGLAAAGRVRNRVD